MKAIKVSISIFLLLSFVPILWNFLFNFYSRNSFLSFNLRDGRITSIPLFLSCRRSSLVAFIPFLLMSKQHRNSFGCRFGSSFNTSLKSLSAEDIRLNSIEKKPIKHGKKDLIVLLFISKIFAEIFFVFLAMHCVVKSLKIRMTILSSVGLVFNRKKFLFNRKLKQVKYRTESCF